MSIQEWVTLKCITSAMGQEVRMLQQGSSYYLRWSFDGTVLATGMFDTYEIADSLFNEAVGGAN